MGSFSKVISTNIMPQKGKQLKLENSEIISVKKYGWSIIQQVLCSHVINVVEILNPNYNPKWDGPEEKYNIGVIVSNAQKGIKHFSEFMPELNNSIDIPDFDKNFSNAMTYFNSRVKQKFFVYDSLELYGMGDDPPQRWTAEQKELARDCKETLKGAKHMVYQSKLKQWLLGNFAPKDIAFDLAWLTDFQSKKAWG